MTKIDYEIIQLKKLPTLSVVYLISTEFSIYQDLYLMKIELNIELATLSVAAV